MTASPTGPAARGCDVPVPADGPARPPLRRALAQVGLRAAAAAVAAVTVARLHAAHDPGVLCPLRLLTGIPCPLCGSTTVFIELGRGDLGAALAANPVTAAAGLGLLLAPLGLGSLWWRTPPRRRGGIVTAALAVAWGWQLGRLGLPDPGPG